MNYTTILELSGGGDANHNTKTKTDLLSDSGHSASLLCGKFSKTGCNKKKFAISDLNLIKFI
jgi:hypothetical protein